MSKRDLRLLEVAGSLERHAMVLRGLQERHAATVLDFLKEAITILANARLEQHELDLETELLYRSGTRILAEAATNLPEMTTATLQRHLAEISVDDSSS